MLRAKDIYTCTHRFQEFGPFLKQRPQIKWRLTEEGVSLGNILWRFQAPAAGRVFHPLSQTSSCGSWRNLRVWLRPSSSAVSCWFIDEGFSEANTDVYRRFHCTGSDLLSSCFSVKLCQSHFSHQMARVVHISKLTPAGHFFILLAREKHKFTSLSRYLQNCCDGSVTVTFDMLHVISITAELCSRTLPLEEYAPKKILCIWSCGLSSNWKWMVINYNDDHCSEKVSCHRLLDDVDLTVSGEKKR